MLSTLVTVLPVFGLIFAGWLARRVNLLGAHATSELNRFVVYLALPALLFDIVAHAHGADVWQPGFIAVFSISTLAVFLLAILVRRRSHDLADAAVVGLDAAYSNAGYLGFPLAALALGADSLAPTTIAMILTICVLFAIAIALIEIGVQTERRLGPLAGKVFLSLARNPLVIAPVLGGCVAAAGVAVPAPAETFLKLLGGAASPCALVALGLFLAEKRPVAARETGFTLFLVALKLVGQPLIAWVLAAFVFDLPPLLEHTAVLIAALPTGTGPFMLAEFYNREAEVTSRAILISTVLSLLTVSAYLAFAHVG